MSDNNILFKIHNKNIIQEILNDIPYKRLLKISEKNKKLQNLLKLNIKIYEKLSKNKNHIPLICSFLDINTSFRKNPKDLIFKLFYVPLMAFKHLKISYGNKIECICKISQRNNSFIFCGENKIFYVKFNNKTGEVKLNEILSNLKESIKYTNYPTEINEMKYIFKSKSILYGIDLSEEDKLLAKELYIHSENKEYDLIKKLTNTSFIIGTTDGECYYFSFDPVFFKVNLRINISIKNIYKYIVLNNETIICSSLNIIYTINCINDIKICENKNNNTEIISLSLNTKNNILASGSINGTLILYSINLNGYFNMIFKKEKLHDYMIFEILPLKNGNFCTCGDDNKLIIFNVIDHSEISINFKHAIRCLMELDDEKMLVSSFDNKVIIFNKVNGKINAIIDNLFSVPKNIIICDDYSFLSLKYNGDVDIMGIDLNDVEKKINIDNLDIIHYDINDDY